MPCTPAHVQGETVPYIICVTKDQGGAVVAESAGLPLAQRAYHIEELQGNAGLAVDSEYYLAHQVQQLSGPETCRLTTLI